jgi:hypothetical protein
MPNRSKASTSLTPPISLAKAKVSYFVYNRQAHSIADCSDTTFKEAVLKLAPHWKDNDEYAEVLEDSMDIHTRWWLLCSLADSYCGMTLYACT